MGRLPLVVHSTITGQLLFLGWLHNLKTAGTSTEGPATVSSVIHLFGLLRCFFYTGILFDKLSSVCPLLLLYVRLIFFTMDSSYFTVNYLSIIPLTTSKYYHLEINRSSTLSPTDPGINVILTVSPTSKT